MKVIFTIQHPAHVHLFRHTINELERRGCDVLVLAREKDIAVKLLDIYNIDYNLLAGPATSIPKLALRQLQYEIGILRQAISFKPDVMIGMGEPSVSHVSSLVGSLGYIFTDTEHATLQNHLAFPFADKVFTPNCYLDDIGPKQIRYPGYHELAYLHPNRFSPTPSVLNELGFTDNDSFVVLRLNAWQAAHDIGDSGISNVVEVVRRLERTGTKVLLSSEPNVPENLQKYQMDIPIHHVHDVLYYADLLIGESATMAAESAVLGTPSIFISTSSRGYIDELENQYGIVHHFSDEDREERGLAKAVSILNDYDEEKWKRCRKQILDDKCDTTAFILKQILSVGA